MTVIQCYCDKMCDIWWFTDEYQISSTRNLELPFHRISTGKCICVWTAFVLSILSFRERFLQHLEMKRYFCLAQRSRYVLNTKAMQWCGISRDILNCLNIGDKINVNIFEVIDSRWNIETSAGAVLRWSGKVMSLKTIKPSTELHLCNLRGNVCNP